MSLTKAKKNQIIEYMLGKVLNSNDVVSKTCENFNISHTTVYRYLLELENKHIIGKVKRGKYKLMEHSYNFSYKNDGTLEEDYVYLNDISPLLFELPANVRKIWKQQ